MIFDKSRFCLPLIGLQVILFNLLHQFCLSSTPVVSTVTSGLSDEFDSDIISFSADTLKTKEFGTVYIRAAARGSNRLRALTVERKMVGSLQIPESYDVQYRSLLIYKSKNILLTESGSATFDKGKSIFMAIQLMSGSPSSIAFSTLLDSDEKYTDPTSLTSTGDTKSTMTNNYIYICVFNSGTATFPRYPLKFDVSTLTHTFFSEAIEVACSMNYMAILSDDLLLVSILGGVSSSVYQLRFLSTTSNTVLKRFHYSVGANGQNLVKDNLYQSTLYHISFNMADLRCVDIDATIASSSSIIEKFPALYYPTDYARVSTNVANLGPFYYVATLRFPLIDTLSLQLANKHTFQLAYLLHVGTIMSQFQTFYYMDTTLISRLHFGYTDITLPVYTFQARYIDIDTCAELDANMVDKDKDPLSMQTYPSIVASCESIRCIPNTPTDCELLLVRQLVSVDSATAVFTDSLADRLIPEYRVIFYPLQDLSKGSVLSAQDFTISLQADTLTITLLLTSIPKTWTLDLATVQPNHFPVTGVGYKKPFKSMPIRFVYPPALPSSTWTPMASTLGTTAAVAVAGVAILAGGSPAMMPILKAISTLTYLPLLNGPFLVIPDLFFRSAINPSRLFSWLTDPIVDVLPPSKCRHSITLLQSIYHCSLIVNFSAPTVLFACFFIFSVLLTMVVHVSTERFSQLTPSTAGSAKTADKLYTLTPVDKPSESSTYFINSQPRGLASRLFHLYTLPFALTLSYSLSLQHLFFSTVHMFFISTPLTVSSSAGLICAFIYVYLHLTLLFLPSGSRVLQSIQLPLRPNRSYFPRLFTLRSMIIPPTLSVLIDTGLQQLIAVLVLEILYLLMLVVLRPYRDRVDAVYELLSIGIIIAFEILKIITLSNVSEHTRQDVLGLMMGLLLAAYLLVAILFSLYSLYRHLRSTFCTTSSPSKSHSNPPESMNLSSVNNSIHAE